MENVGSFTPTSAYAGQRLMYGDGRFVIDGSGEVDPAYLKEWDAGGDIQWASEETRAWFLTHFPSPTPPVQMGSMPEEESLSAPGPLSAPFVASPVTTQKKRSGGKILAVVLVGLFLVVAVSCIITSIIFPPLPPDPPPPPPEDFWERVALLEYGMTLDEANEIMGDEAQRVAAESGYGYYMWADEHGNPFKVAVRLDDMVLVDVETELNPPPPPPPPPVGFWERAARVQEGMQLQEANAIMGFQGEMQSRMGTGAQGAYYAWSDGSGGELVVSYRTDTLVITGVVGQTDGPRDERFTKEMFDQVQVGMTYEQACDIMGAEPVMTFEGYGEYSPPIYQWANDGGTVFSVGIKDGVVWSKSDSGY